MPNDSVVVNFETPYADVSTTTGGVVLARANKEPEGDIIVFFRAHGADGCEITTTSGSVSRTQPGLSRFCVDSVVFNGSSEAGLKYPKANSVTWKILGSLLDLTGAYLKSPSLIYDNTDGGKMVVYVNGVETSCYGVVQLTYNAPYDLWQAKFAGVCPLQQDAKEPTVEGQNTSEDDVLVEGREAMLIMARKEGAVVATLELEAPECQYPGSGVDGGGASSTPTSGAQQSTLLIEEDPDYRMGIVGGRESTGGATNILQAGGRLRVYSTTDGVSVSATSGEVYRATSIGSSERTVRVTLTFNGTSSGKLPYPPSDPKAVSLSLVGEAIDIWGRTAGVSIVGGSSSVTEVTWRDPTFVSGATKRTTNPDEVVLVNYRGYAIPCYAAVEAEYKTSFSTYKYEYTYSNGKFEDATVVAHSGTAVATYNLPAPTTRSQY